MKDFFISYNSHDQEWADWLAWTLGAAGYTVAAQSGGAWFTETAAVDARRSVAAAQATIVVVSERYLQSEYIRLEWASVFAPDLPRQPHNLIPIRVAECLPTGLLGQLAYVDLVGVPEDLAADFVLNALRVRLQSAQGQNTPPPGSIARSTPTSAIDPATVRAENAATVSGLQQRSFDTVATANPIAAPIQATLEATQGFQEDLGFGNWLEMVSIPGGTFFIGAPETEADSTDAERPRRLVRVNAFATSKYPVTQAQWRAVAAWPQINYTLEPNCSKFKDLQHPVEQVSWYEAVEFCDRLSRKTGRTYRLPTETEWEYACRSGTRTAFHFGDTITTAFANYNGSRTEPIESKETYRRQTIAVGRFPSNGFGLYDMHGNVLEWCLDHGHDSYKGIPTDGRAWVKDGNPNLRVARGGSWLSYRSACRSAARDFNAPANRYANIGFRVVCSTPEVS